MKPLLSATDMQTADRAAIERLGIPEASLMELAGAAASRIALSRFENTLPQELPSLVVCGKGNNGGDGFVIARHLLNAGCPVDVVLLSPTSELGASSSANLALLEAYGEEGAALRLFESHDEALPFVCEEEYALLVDAISGTGLRLEGPGAPLTSPLSEGIALLNSLRARSGAITLAVDIPSGLDATTGHAAAETVEADLTVTMAFEKLGCRLNDGPAFTGELEVADISIPAFLIENPSALLVDEAFAAEHYPLRGERSAKHQNGKVLIIAGSSGAAGSMLGAAILAATGARNTGAGYLALSVPSPQAAPIHAAVPEAVVIGRSFEAIIEKAGWADAIVLGCGLGRDPDAVELVERLLTHEAVRSKKLVIDADALWAIAEEGMEELLQGCREAVLTPHAGEFARLAADLSIMEPLAGAEAFAARYGVTLLLKGSPTIICPPEGPPMLSASGTEALATAGTGDLLAGMIAALAAKGEALADAAAAAAWLHGRAGDLAADISSIVSSSLVAGSIGAAIGELFEFE